jgi:general secretion pathway protein I
MRRRARAGFTLIEVLVALAVISISLPVVGSLLAANLKGTLTVEHRSRLVAAYRALEASSLDRTGLSPGRRTGELDSIAWSMDVRLLGEDETGARGIGTWVPRAIVTTLRAPSGETLRIETIRLGRGGAP